MEPHQRIKLCFPAYNTGYVSDEKGLVVTTGIEPVSSRVSGGCLHRLSYVTFVGQPGVNRTLVTAFQAPDSAIELREVGDAART